MLPLALLVFASLVASLATGALVMVVVAIVMSYPGPPAFGFYWEPHPGWGPAVVVPPFIGACAGFLALVVLRSQFQRAGWWPDDPEG